MRAALEALVLSIWAAIHPGLEKSGDAREIASAIAVVILEDAPRAPVFGSHAEDLAVMAYFAKLESDIRKKPGHYLDPRTKKEIDPIAYGPWQEHTDEGKTALEYARSWLALLHEGKRRCPTSPAAPICGSCLLARPVADRRVRKARVLLRAALGMGPN